MRCPRSWEVRAADEGRLGPLDMAALERHTRSCAECSRERGALEALRALTKQLPPTEPTELELRRLRGRVMSAAMSPRAPRAFAAQLTFALVAMAITALAIVVVHRRTTKPSAAPASMAALVTPTAPAQWTQGRDGTVERVILKDGELTLHVRKQSPGERFLVLVPDGEIEVRGTTFEVSVQHGHATRVHVEEGVVVVRVGSESIVTAGGTWVPAVATSIQEPPTVDAGISATNPPPKAVSTPVLSAPRRQIGTASGAATAPSSARPVEALRQSEDREMSEYQHAIDVYRLGRFEEAGELLQVFVAAYPSSALIEDATFIQAAAAARNGRLATAARLAERHLARFPTSFHRKEAAILIARAHREENECAQARAALAPWLGGATLDPEVASALGRCVEPAGSSVGSGR